MRETPFQREIKLNDEFYSGEQIRELVRKHFPVKDGLHQGLARLVAFSSYFHGDKQLDLEAIIPDITKETEIPDPLSRGHCYLVVEGEPHTSGTTATVFIPTDLGYICDEKMP